MSRHLPDEGPGSAEARTKVSAGWLDATAFENLLRMHDRGGRTLPQLTESGSVLGVWLPEKQGFFYPVWQLTPSGNPTPVLAELLALLRGPYGVSQGKRSSGWEEIEWLVAPHALLGGRPPSVMLGVDPGLVLDVARQDFSSWSDGARW